MHFVPRQFFALLLSTLMLSMVAVAQSQGSTTTQTPSTAQTSDTATKTPPATNPPDVDTAKAQARKESQDKSKQAADAKVGGEEKPAAKDAKDQKNPESDFVPGKKKPVGAPTTKTMAAPKEIVAADALLAAPPPPSGKISLIGGQVKNIDQIRNRMEVSIFGGGKMKMLFDERSHFYRDGVETTQLAVKKGDRIYVDSQLDQGKIFARNVRVQSDKPIAAASGQVIAYNPKNGELTLREPISAKPLSFLVTSRTAFRRGDQPGSMADLRNNAIVRVTFAPVPGRRSELKDVDLIAVPGTKFTFYGTLTHLDLRSGLLGVENKSDSRLYEVRFRPNAQTVTDDLVVGAEVSIVAVFTGKDYAAESLRVTSGAANQKVDDKEN